MRKLGVVGIGLVLLLVVFDVVARLVAESKLASRAEEALADAGSAEADISSFPFLGRLLLSNTIPRVQVTVRGGRAGPLRLAAVAVDARAVELDRAALFSGKVRVDDIDRGVVAVELDARSLSETLNVPVAIAGGRVRVNVRGADLDADVEPGRNGEVVLRVARLPAFTVPVPRTPLLACSGTRAEVVGDRVRLSCEIDDVPAPLRG